MPNIESVVVFSVNWLNNVYINLNTIVKGGVFKKKKIHYHYGCSVRIEIPSHGITVRHYLASLVMPKTVTLVTEFSIRTTQPLKIFIFSCELRSEQYMHFLWKNSLPTETLAWPSRPTRTWSRMLINVSIALHYVHCITLTSRFNFDTSEPHFYRVEWGFSGVYIILHFMDFRCFWMKFYSRVQDTCSVTFRTRNNPFSDKRILATSKNYWRKILIEGWPGQQEH